jgi:aryl-alcohol dehydrogenase-like predicted oxidoreductase
MNFGKRTPAAESERIVKRALACGLMFFDTANMYSDGDSERILGKAIGVRRGECLIATKVGLMRHGGKPEGLSRKAILSALDASLKRLGTDYVDVYYLHAPDHSTPIEETLDTIAELLERKKILTWGVSNYASWQILEMNALADARNMARPIISQVVYNLLLRQIEVEYLAFAARYPIHTTVYNPLAGGLLSGKYGRNPGIEQGSRFDKNPMYQRRYWTDRMFDLVDALRPIAEAEGLSMVDFSYAWLAKRPGVDSILVGPVTVDHLDSAIEAVTKKVSPEAVAKVDEAHVRYLGTDTNYVR